MNASGFSMLILMAGCLPAFAQNDAIDAGLNCIDTKHPKQIEECTKAIRLKPNGQEVLYTSRGDAYAEIGERDKAIADFRDALRVKPKYLPATVGLSRLGVKP